MLRSDDGKSLALLFHWNSKPWPIDSSAAAPNVPLQLPLADFIPLPRPEQSSSLTDLLDSRRSCRAFAEPPMEAADLGCILQSAYVGTQGKARPGPSAGGIYPFELYVIAARVNGLHAGIYHFNSPLGGLERMSPPPPAAQFQSVFLYQAWAAAAQAVIVLAARLEPTLRKYGPRGYRYLLLEAGHVAQNITLLAAERSLSSVCMGGFEDSELNLTLGLDGSSQAALYSVAVGSE